MVFKAPCCHFGLCWMLGYMNECGQNNWGSIVEIVGIKFQITFMHLVSYIMYVILLYYIGI